MKIYIDVGFKIIDELEEVFCIISGTATLKTPKGDIKVSEGDVIVMPPNENGVHKPTNNSNEQLLYLDVHTVGSPEVVIYPDTGKVRILAGDMQKSFKIDSEVNYLDGEQVHPWSPQH